MTEINARLKGDESLRTSLEDSTERFLSARDSIRVLRDRNHPGGGTDHIKCLHAHVAHQLVAGDNPVGRQVIDNLVWIEPEEPCV